MKKYKLHTLSPRCHIGISFGFFFACLAAYAEDPFNIYLVSQTNGEAYLNDATMFSPDGDYQNAYPADGLDGQWQYADVIINALYTGADVNAIHTPNSNLTINSLTVSDNWDNTIDANKSAVWLFGNDLATTDTPYQFNILGNFEIYSGINGPESSGGTAYKGVQLSAKDIYINVSANKHDGSGSRSNRDVRLQSFSSISADNFIVDTAGRILMRYAYYSDAEGSLLGGVDISNDIVLKDLTSFLAEGSAKFHVGNDVSITNMSGDFTVENTGKNSGTIVNGIDIGGDFTVRNGTSKTANLRFTNSGYLNIDGVLDVEGASKIYLRNIGMENGSLKEGMGITLGGLKTTNVDEITYYNSGFFKVNGDVNLDGVQWWVGYSSTSGYITGGVEVSGNFHATDMNNFQVWYSPYIKVGGNFIMDGTDGSTRNMSVDAESVSLFQVGGNVEVAKNFTFHNAGELKVGGDFVVGGEAKIYNTESANIAGDVVLGAGSYFNTGFNNGVDSKGSVASIDNPNLYVGGRILMTERTNPSDVNYKVRWSSSVTEQFAYSKGLHGSGIISLDRAGGPSVVRQTFIFDNNKSDGVSSWEGKVYNLSYGGENEIIMNIVKKGGGEQVFKVTDGRWHGALDVQEGTFRMSTVGSGDYNVDVSINGGDWGAAESNGYYDLVANNISWNSGRIIFHILDGNYSLMIAESLILGAADSYEFLVEYDPMLDLTGLSVELRDFMLITNGITEAEVNKMSMRTADGKYLGTFDGEWSGNWEYATFVFAYIPEPSAIAAVFGALALAFAAYRRKRK